MLHAPPHPRLFRCTEAALTSGLMGEAESSWSSPACFPQLPSSSKKKVSHSGPSFWPHLTAGGCPGQNQLSAGRSCMPQGGRGPWNHSTEKALGLPFLSPISLTQKGNEASEQHWGWPTHLGSPNQQEKPAHSGFSFSKLLFQTHSSSSDCTENSKSLPVLKSPPRTHCTGHSNSGTR